MKFCMYIEIVRQSICAKYSVNICNDLEVNNGKNKVKDKR